MRITIRLKNGDESSFEADLVGETLGVYRADSPTPVASFTASEVDEVRGYDAEGQSVDVPKGELRRVVVIQPITPHEPPREAYPGLYTIGGQDPQGYLANTSAEVVGDASANADVQGKPGGETEEPLSGEVEDVGFHEPTEEAQAAGFEPLYPGHRNELPPPPES